uniref:Uncharacterized protein n=1 Tax=Escherichia coli TaxID=562 RepID=A0A2R4AJK1_ECOLX|nr:hypothetical protein p508-3_00129 [Escherichia coli]
MTSLMLKLSVKQHHVHLCVSCSPEPNLSRQCELCIVSRESLVQDKVKTTNQMHAFLLEFGISVPRGAAVISRLSTLLRTVVCLFISASYC